MMAKQNGWAIVGVHGIYVGWWQKRADAIAQHVYDTQPARAMTLDHGFALSGLSPEQKAVWKECKRRGDRAVKVTITYPAA